MANLKALYGTGHIQFDADGKLHRVGVVEYTIKDGIVYNARELLADVRKMVADDMAKRGIIALSQS